MTLWQCTSHFFIFEIGSSNDYGNKLVCQITNRGVLKNIECSCAPTLTFPPSPIKLDSMDAKHIVAGKIIKTSNSNSNYNNITIAESNIYSSSLVIALIRCWSTPAERRTMYMEYRKAWKLELNCKELYVDAVTGQYLDYIVDKCIDK